MDLNRYIDYTNLKATATLRDIELLCNTAIKNNFYSVCIHPCYVKLASALLKDTNVLVTTVVGFPLGNNTVNTKAYEAIECVNNGADEIDLVINLAFLKNKDYEYIKDEIEEIRDSIDGKILKVIIETCYLNEAEIKKLTEICNETFVNFIKTSTGFGTRGVTIKDIDTINKYKSETLEIKASGGIKDEGFVIDLLEKGVTRLGMSDVSKLGSDK